MKWDPRDCHSGLSGARSEQRAGKLTYGSRSLEAWGFCSHVCTEHHGCSKPSSQVPPPLNIALTCPLIPPLTPHRSYISANWRWAQVTQGQCMMLRVSLVLHASWTPDVTVDSTSASNTETLCHVAAVWGSDLSSWMGMTDDANKRTTCGWHLGLWMMGWLSVVPGLGVFVDQAGPRCEAWALGGALGCLWCSQTVLTFAGHTYEWSGELLCIWHGLHYERIMSM